MDSGTVEAPVEGVLFLQLFERVIKADNDEKRPNLRFSGGRN